MSRDEDFQGLYRQYPSEGRGRHSGDRRLDSTVLLEGTWAEFSADLRRAVAVWRTVPWLPIVSALVGGGSFGGGFGTSANQSEQFVLSPILLAVSVVFFLAIGIFSLGWPGSERLVYARMWENDPIGFREAFGATWGYIGRFVRLGLLVVLPALVVGAVLRVGLGDVIAPAVVSFVLFVVLTFVVPSLVYDEERARDAMRVGWHVLRRQGRRAAWYALVPPAVLAVAYLGSVLPSIVGWLCHALSGVLALALKGAIASAYVRITTSSADLDGHIDHAGAQ